MFENVLYWLAFLTLIYILITWLLSFLIMVTTSSTLFCWELVRHTVTWRPRPHTLELWITRKKQVVLVNTVNCPKMEDRLPCIDMYSDYILVFILSIRPLFVPTIFFDIQGWLFDSILNFVDTTRLPRMTLWLLRVDSDHKHPINRSFWTSSFFYSLQKFPATLNHSLWAGILLTASLGLLYHSPTRSNCWVCGQSLLMGDVICTPFL